MTIPWVRPCIGGHGSSSVAARFTLEDPANGVREGRAGAASSVRRHRQNVLVTPLAVGHNVQQSAAACPDGILKRLSRKRKFVATHRLAPELRELSGCTWSFAGRTFDESRLELRVGGAVVDLELKPLEVLLYLLRHGGEVVSKSELLDAVWPGLSVVEGSLSTAVYKLRKALGDHDSSIVVTVPRVGHRPAAAASRRGEPSVTLAVESKAGGGGACPWSRTVVAAALARHLIWQRGVACRAPQDPRASCL